MVDFIIFIKLGESKMTKRDFIEDVYDNLMKNTHYKPTDFSKIEDCWIDYDTFEIYIGDFVLTAKEVSDDS